MIIFIIILLSFAIFALVKGTKKTKKQNNNTQKRTIVSVEIWNEETKHRSGAGRAAIGGAMFGVAGAVVGAATKTDKDFVTFKVTYSDGEIEFPRVAVGSLAYKTWLSVMQTLEKRKI